MMNWDGSMFAHVDGLPDPPMPQAQHGRSASDAAGTAFGARGGYQIAGFLLEDVFTRLLCLPVSERWREAVSTALLGDWINPLFRGQLLKPDEVVGQLRAEAREFHRQAVPLWRRRSHGRRVLLLDMPMGENVTLSAVVRRGFSWGSRRENSADSNRTDHKRPRGPRSRPGRAGVLQLDVFRRHLTRIHPGLRYDADQPRRP